MNTRLSNLILSVLFAVLVLALAAVSVYNPAPASYAAPAAHAVVVPATRGVYAKSYGVVSLTVVPTTHYNQPSTCTTPAGFWTGVANADVYKATYIHYCMLPGQGTASAHVKHNSNTTTTVDGGTDGTIVPTTPTTPSVPTTPTNPIVPQPRVKTNHGNHYGDGKSGKDQPDNNTHDVKNKFDGVDTRDQFEQVKSETKPEKKDKPAKSSAAGVGLTLFTLWGYRKIAEGVSRRTKLFNMYYSNASDLVAVCKSFGIECDDAMPAKDWDRINK